uniref:Uncharacterized protein n=1 Tax=Timema bartmani TaxID=61472 RepID=A0A7R9HXU7_9NEOP|nr:unnamed protein product [Timema bartmani]
MSVKMAGQTINDRLLAARHSLAGQGLAKSVCKATTEEMIGPKKKHLDWRMGKPFRKTIQCTRLGSNPELPVCGSLVQHKRSALDHVATKVGDKAIIYDNHGYNRI